MVVGLTAAVLQGAHVVTQDIDLWVKDLGSSSFKQALQDVGAFYIPPSLHAQTPPMLGPERYSLINLVISMSGLGTFEEESKHIKQIDVDGLILPVLSLDRVITSKEAANRAKDRAVLPILLATKSIISSS